jgi:hypothetical protein
MTAPGSEGAATPPGAAREAAERNARAVMTGNLAQLMADISPEALNQMMQMASQAQADGSLGGLNLAALPSVEGYELTEVGRDGDDEVFHVTFHSTAGSATLMTKWRQLMGQWKIVGIGRVQEPAEEA